MRRWQISVARMVGLVLVVGVGLATLTLTEPVWSGVVLYVVAAILLAAALRARFGRREVAAWWFGFALFGWAYLLLGLAVPQLYESSYRLPTHALTMELALINLDRLRALHPELLSELPQRSDLDHLVMHSGRLFVEWYFVKAHALMSLLVAIVGGWLASAIDMRRRAEAERLEAGRASE